MDLHFKSLRKNRISLKFIALCGIAGLLALEGCARSVSGNSGPAELDFSNGKFDYLLVDASPVGANRARLALIDYGGRKAVRVELSGGGIPYVVIDASSILGEAVRELREMQVSVAVENPDGEFYAVSGEILAYSGTARTESADHWSVYLPHKNPNIARAVLDGEGEYFVPGAYNFFILTRKVDNAIEAGAAPGNLIITGMRFLDAQGRDLRVNPNAGFAAPEGFGEPDRSNLYAVAEEITLDAMGGGSKGWGQAVALTTLKSGGGLDAQDFGPDSILTVYYSSAAPPELILQSWTEGAPEGAGWAKVAPAAVNDSSTTAQYLYRDMAAAFGGGDFAAYLDRLYVGDTGKELKVYAVTLGNFGDARYETKNSKNF
jgi:hypothetical protein